jgi:hypothetical protein
MSQTRALPINAGQRHICWIFGRSYGDHPALTPPSPSRAVTPGPQRCGHRRAPTACPHPAVPPRRPFGSQTYCPARSPTTSEWTSTNDVQNVKQPWPGVPARAVSRSARCSADAVEGSEGLSNSRTAVITKRKTRWSRICRAQLRLLWNAVYRRASETATRPKLAANANGCTTATSAANCSGYELATVCA